MFARLRQLIQRALALDSAVAANVRNLDDVAQRTFQIQRETLRHLILQQPRYADERRLSRHEFSVYSQSGQDGIIEEIFRRIGVTSKLFVEFGVGAGGGFENNSTYLLAKGWKGNWIEADFTAFQRINSQADFLIRSGALNLVNAHVTAENIRGLFEQFSVPVEFDLLSIDIDSNDYWIWEKLAAYRPRVVVIEYNSFLPASADWILPYEPSRIWEPMTIEFGASLKALEKAGKEMGYSLVGCDLSGSDAFFVRADLVADHFCRPDTAENHYEPMRYYLIKSWGYKRTLNSTFGTIS